MIYGKYGFPKLGVKGAAIATVFSKVIEAIIILSIVYYKKYIIAGTLKVMFSFSNNLLLKFLKNISLI